VTIAALAGRLRSGELSPRDAVEAYLARIAELDPQLNAYISVQGDAALAAAAALEGTGGERGPLWGVPVAVKDVIDVEGVTTTAASKVLADAPPARADAFAVERLRAAGAIVLGKLNTHEFAYGAMTTSRHFGPARNPWATDRICGGSSGGSGAAAAADLAAGTLGTDTAGSIRIPACFCGVTGVRPTTGRVSNRGVVAVSWTFDTVGPIARTAEDCALMLEAIAGYDPADPSTAAVPVHPYASLLAGGVEGLRIGVVQPLLEQGIDPGIAACVRDALGELEAAGARLVEVALPLLDELGTIQQAIQFTEATSAHLATLRTRLGDYGTDVRARLLTGLFVPSTTTVLGQRARRLAYDGFRSAFERVDLLAAPTMPVVAPRIGEDTVRLGDAIVPYRLTLIPFNSPWSCVGAPVVSVPCGFVDGLPVGLALVGRRYDEATALRTAHTFQEATDWHERRPSLAREAPEEVVP
jgi:aspartyl-tRNA(Asn)/glutamyl-tRNA(Gln) amidotransferase subunit A